MKRLFAGAFCLWLWACPMDLRAAPAQRRPTMWPTSAPSRPRRHVGKAPTTPRLPRPVLSTYRRALGVLATSYCYQTFFALEGASKAMVTKGYRRFEVRQRMAATQRTLAASRSSLQEVRKSLGLRDRRALTAIIETLTALKDEAAALEEWARTNRKADRRIFEDRRRAAHRRLRKLLR